MVKKNFRYPFGLLFREVSDMTTYDYLKYLQHDIHTVVVAMVDDDGVPVTCAVDIMDYDDGGLYFLTAKGKSFYNRLAKCGSIALTGIKGKDTLHAVAVSVRGNVQEIGNSRLPQIFAKNPYMKKIYPTVESQKALTVFKLYEGTGEWFNLSKKPIERASFSIGSMKPKPEGYYIAADVCIGCHRCENVCPQGCIDFKNVSAKILQENCLHCGNCWNACPVGAVKKAGESAHRQQEHPF